MKYWVFDLDGTLVNSFAFYLEIVHEIFASLEVEFPTEITKTCLGMPAEKFLESQLGFENLPHAMRILHKRNAENSKDILAFSGVDRVLSLLRESGTPIAVWTSRDRDSASQLLNQTGLMKHCEKFVTGSCVTNHKPHTEGLEAIRQHFQCKPNELVLVGDHDFDMHAAKSFGATAVRASWHGFDPPDSCHLADHHFFDVQEFTQWIINK